MPGGYPQNIGAVSGFTSGGGAVLPLLVAPSGDGFTGILQIGGITATIGFPFNTTADNQSPAVASAVGLLGFDGANMDRVRVANAGTNLMAATQGVLVVQGTTAGAPLPVFQPYSGLADAQVAVIGGAVGIAAINSTGAVDRIRSATLGQSLGAGSPGVLVVQGAPTATPIPVSGSFTTAFPYSTTSDAQSAAAASATALVAFNGSTLDRVISRPLGTAAAAATAGALVVQSSPNASPFPVAPIGQGALFPVPAGTANGTVIGTMPAGSQGVRIYVPPNCTFTYTVAASAPGSPPSTVSFQNPSTSSFPVVIDENLNGQNVYVTNPTIANTALLARWI